jgi:hypothetical protein
VYRDGIVPRDGRRPEDVIVQGNGNFVYGPYQFVFKAVSFSSWRRKLSSAQGRKGFLSVEINDLELTASGEDVQSIA